MPRIDVVEHSKYIMKVALRYRKEFPSISLSDIFSELTFLVIEMSEKSYNPKYKATTFIENFAGKKLRQVLIYKYINFTYDENKNRLFVETCSIDSKVTNDFNSPEYSDSLKLVEADCDNDYSSNKVGDDEYEVVDLISKSNLLPIEKEVMYRRVGVNEFKIMTLEEIGKEFNLTKERIRLIEKAAKDKLKSFCIAKEIY